MTHPSSFPTSSGSLKQSSRFNSPWRLLIGEDSHIDTSAPSSAPPLPEELPSEALEPQTQSSSSQLFTDDRPRPVFRQSRSSRSRTQSAYIPALNVGRNKSLTLNHVIKASDEPDLPCATEGRTGSASVFSKLTKRNLRALFGEQKRAMSVPAHSGYLTKLGAKFATWRRRYFVLAGTRLYYAKSEAEADSRRWMGEIDIHGAKVIVHSDEDEICRTHPDRSFLLSVCPAATSRSYLISAANEEERGDWVLKIRQHVQMESTELSRRLLKDIKSLREGYLTKLGEKVKNWKRRYFVLTDNHLRYYRAFEDREPAGSILLLGTRIALEQKSLVGANNAFSITTSDGRRKYVIFADTQSDSQEWFDAVQACSQFVAEIDPEEEEEVGDEKVANRTLDHRLTVEKVVGAAGDKGKGVKQKVSKKKRRFVIGGLDLDLTYITDRIIAMGFPSENLEAMYRNRMQDVQKFLDTRHADSYRVYNLCSERSYESSKFHDNVCRFPFDDHNCPNFEDLIPLCEDMNRWMLASPDNVVCIHCKAGKGRTGLIICVYLLYSKAWERASEALSYYAFVRTKDQKGVTIPSQRRYVHYFERYLQDPDILTNDKPLVLNEIFVSKGCKNFDSVEIKNHGNKLLSKDWGKYWKETVSESDSTSENSSGVDGWLLQMPKGDVVLQKDFKLEIFSTSLLGKKNKVLSFWLHTAFIENDIVELDRSSTDKVNKEKGAPLRIQLFFGTRSFYADGIKHKEEAAVGQQQRLDDPNAPLDAPDDDYEPLNLGINSPAAMSLNLSGAAPWEENSLSLSLDLGNRQEDDPDEPDSPDNTNLKTADSTNQYGKGAKGSRRDSADGSNDMVPEPIEEPVVDEMAHAQYADDAFKSASEPKPVSWWHPRPPGASSSRAVPVPL